MSQVNPARFQDEQNMEALRTPDGDQIYFRVTRDITSGEELRVWLAPSLEEEHGLRRTSEEAFKGRLYQGYFESSILSNKALFRVYIGSLKLTREEGLYNFR